MDRNEGSQADSSPLTQIYFWGNDRNGLLGPDKNPKMIYSRPQPFDFGVKIDSISCGDSHAAFVSDGYIYTMGDNSDGRLGILKNIKSASSPMLIESLIKFYVVKVACGATHTIALTDSGEVFVWGNGEYGQLGLGTRQNQLMPQQIKLYNSNETPNKNAPPDSAIDISCGKRHSGVITSSGEIYMFGSNEFGQLGDGTNQDKFAPVKITLPGEKAQRIACGDDYTLVLTAKGHIYGFGLNSTGQLGIGNQDDANVPVRSLLPESVFFSKIMAGYHSAAITSHGEMYVWGESTLGNFLIPREITWDDDMIIAGLEMGEDFTIVIDSKERVWGFGNNTKGELAQGDVEEKESLVQIPDLSSKKVKAFACGKEFVIALSDFGNELKLPRNSSKSIKYIKEVQDSEKASQSEIQYEEADDSVIRQESELGSVSDRFSHPHQHHHHGQNNHYQHHQQHQHHHIENKPRGSRNSKGGVWKEFETNMNHSNTEDQIENSETSTNRDERNNEAYAKGDNVRNIMVDIKILRLQNILLEKQLEERSQQIGYLRRKVKDSQTKKQKIREKEQKYKELLLNLEAQNLKIREEGLKTSEELMKKKAEIEKFKTTLDEKNACIESLLKDNNTLRELVHYFIQLRTMTHISPQASSELEIRISNLLGSLDIEQARIFNAATVAAAANLKSAMTQNTDSSRLHSQYDRQYSPSNSPQSRATVLRTQSSAGLTPIKEYGLEQSSVKNTTPNRETIQPNHKAKKLSIKIGQIQQADHGNNDELRPTTNALAKVSPKSKPTKPNAKSYSSMNLASFPTPKNLISSYGDHFPKPVASVKNATTTSDKFTSLHKKKFSEPTLNLKPIHTQYGEERNLKQVVNNYIRTLPTENDKMGYHSSKNSSRASREFQFNTVTTPVKEKSKKIVPTLQISPFLHEDSRRPESSQLYKKLLDMLHVPFKSTPTSTVNTLNSAKSGPKLSAQLSKQNNYFK